MVVEIIMKLIHGLERELERAYRRLFNHFPHHPACRHNHRVRQVLFIVINSNKYILMGTQKLRLDKGFHVQSALLDAVTNEPIPGATKVLKSLTSDSPDVLLVNADNDTIPQKLGVGKLTVVNTWTYTDLSDPDAPVDVTSDQTTVLDFQVIAGPEGVLQTVVLVPFDQQPVA